VKKNLTKKIGRREVFTNCKRYGGRGLMVSEKISIFFLKEVKWENLGLYQGGTQT